MSKSEEREDFLEEDVEIPGQKFCLLSFLSPEKVLKDKNVFFFQSFLKDYEFQCRTKNLETFLIKTMNDFNGKMDAEADSLLAKDLSGASDICRSSKVRVETVMSEFHSFVKKHESELKESALKESYDDFMFKNSVALENDFYAKNEFKTTVRGLKIRGVYGSQAEAVARSKKLQRQDTVHNIFVGEVGKWLPWDPEPNDVAEQEYAEEQLNTLMKKYKENEEHRESFQRERRTMATKAKNTAPTMELASDDTAVVNSATEGAATQFSSMFGSSGPADLAMARKMDASGSAL
jgi:hypothetical protein